MGQIEFMKTIILLSLFSTLSFSKNLKKPLTLKDLGKIDYKKTMLVLDSKLKARESTKEPKIYSQHNPHKTDFYRQQLREDNPYRTEFNNRYINPDPFTPQGRRALNRPLTN